MLFVALRGALLLSHLFAGAMGCSSKWALEE